MQTSDEPGLGSSHRTGCVAWGAVPRPQCPQPVRRDPKGLSLPQGVCTKHASGTGLHLTPQLCWQQGLEGTEGGDREAGGVSVTSLLRGQGQRHQHGTAAPPGPQTGLRGPLHHHTCAGCWGRPCPIMSTAPQQGAAPAPYRQEKCAELSRIATFFFPCTLSKPLGTDVQSLHYSRAPGLLGTDWSERPKPCPTSLPALAVKAPSPQSSLFLRARLCRSRAGDVLHCAPTSGRAAPHRSSGMCGPQALPARISAQPLPWNKKVQMSP